MKQNPRNCKSFIELRTEVFLFITVARQSIRTFIGLLRTYRVHTFYMLRETFFDISLVPLWDSARTIISMKLEGRVKISIEIKHSIIDKSQHSVAPFLTLVTRLIIVHAVRWFLAKRMLAINVLWFVRAVWNSSTIVAALDKDFPTVSSVQSVSPKRKYRQV